MIRINQLKLPIDHTREDLAHKISKELKIPEHNIKKIQIVKQSVDARKKDHILYIYTVNVSADKENQIIKKLKNPQISSAPLNKYCLPEYGLSLIHISAWDRRVQEKPIWPWLWQFRLLKTEM